MLEARAEKYRGSLVFATCHCQEISEIRLEKLETIFIMSATDVGP